MKLSSTGAITWVRPLEWGRGRKGGGGGGGSEKCERVGGRKAGDERAQRDELTR